MVGLVWGGGIFWVRYVGEVVLLMGCGWVGGTLFGGWGVYWWGFVVNLVVFGGCLGSWRVDFFFWGGEVVAGNVRKLGGQRELTEIKIGGIGWIKDPLGLPNMTYI